MSLLAIDPGKRTGWALFSDAELEGCGHKKPEQLGEIPSAHFVLIEQPRWYPKERKIDLNDLLDLSVLVGRIQENHEGRIIATSGNLKRIEVATLVYLRNGTLVSELADQWNLSRSRVHQVKNDAEKKVQVPEVELVYPRTWKGTVPKHIMCQRIYEKLTPEEKKLLPLKRGRKVSKSAEDHDHNVIDAVGLGLWKLGRL